MGEAFLLQIFYNNNKAGEVTLNMLFSSPIDRDS